MIRIVKVVDPDCSDCFGASFGDCPDCGTRTSEFVVCKDCRFNSESMMFREKTLCRKLHAWVEPCDFCAWGERKEVEE